MGRIRTILSIVLLALPSTTACAFDDQPRFEVDVRPILKAHCWQCHGEEKELHGGMDARLVQFLLKGGESGAAIVVGDHAASLLYQRMASGEMPPGKKKVSPQELAQVAKWIDAGAMTVRTEPEALAVGDTFTDEERQHWAFLPILKPAIPDVTHAELGRTRIDAFLLAGLERQGLSFSPEAGRETTATTRACYKQRPTGGQATDRARARTGAQAPQAPVQTAGQGPHAGGPGASPQRLSSDHHLRDRSFGSVSQGGHVQAGLSQWDNGGDRLAYPSYPSYPSYP